MDIIGDIMNAMEKVNASRPYYEDKNKNYLFVFSENHPYAADLKNAAFNYTNVTAKLVKPEYFPDKNSVYVMQEP